MHGHARLLNRSEDIRLQVCLHGQAQPVHRVAIAVISQEAGQEFDAMQAVGVCRQGEFSTES